MTSRLTRVVLIVLLVAAPVAGQEKPAGDPKGAIDRLSAFDHPTRMNASRTLRRMAAADVVPLLVQAVRAHPDTFVRYRALVLLTAFNDRGTPDLMRTLLGDRNDRVREVAYRWFERNPDTRLTPTLLAALNTEQAEFVRPALVRALAALGKDPQVQRALLVETGRGLDFFRSAVIEALGEHRAAYALDTLTTVAGMEGPLQDDAVMALGRIGDRRALATLSAFTNPPLEIVPSLQAAFCLLEDGCAVRITVLTDTARSRAATADAARGAVAALGVVAAQGHEGATAALVALGGEGGAGRLKDDVALAFSGVALRNPDHVIAWLGAAGEDVRARAVDLLKSGFDALEEDFAEEQFYAAARASYWGSAENSETRTLTAALIDKFEF